MNLADIVCRIQTAEGDLSAGSARGEVPVVDNFRRVSAL
jgi:hypothetical protein